MQDELGRWVKVWHYTIYAMATQMVGGLMGGALRVGATGSLPRAPSAGGRPAGPGPAPLAVSSLRPPLAAVQPRQLMPEARELLDAQEYEVYVAAATRRQMPWLKMQQLLAEAAPPNAQALLMDTWLQRCDAEADTVARFRSTALPYNLTLLNTGFLQIWILLLPIGFIQHGNWWALWPYFWLALLLLACDELATQLEVCRPQRRGGAGPRACCGRVSGALVPAPSLARLLGLELLPPAACPPPLPQDPFAFLPCRDILQVQVRDVQK